MQIKMNGENQLNCSTPIILYSCSRLKLKSGDNYLNTTHNIASSFFLTTSNLIGQYMHCFSHDQIWLCFLVDPPKSMGPTHAQYDVSPTNPFG